MTPNTEFKVTLLLNIEHLETIQDMMPFPVTSNVGSMVALQDVFHYRQVVCFLLLNQEQ